MITGWIEEHGDWFAAFVAVSAMIFVASLIAGPMLIARIPADYFTHDRRPPSRFARRHIALRLIVIAARNMLGIVLVLAGIVMLVLPGQGLLTIFAGFVLIDLPGKYRIEKWIVSRRWIRRGIDWLRERAGREPLIITDDSTDAP